MDQVPPYCNQYHHCQVYLSEEVEKSERERQETDVSDLKSTLKELVQAQQETEYLDLSEQSITSIEGDLMPYICQFTKLKEVNLEDNLLSKLPDNMS